VPIEIGEMDGRNAGSAVIGFVNGMYRIIFSFSTHFGQKRKTEGKSKSLSLSFVPLRETNIHEDIFGMIQQNETHDNRRNEIEKKKRRICYCCCLEIKIK